MRKNFFIVMIGQALASLIWKIVGWTSGLVLAMGLGTHYSWVLSQLRVGGIYIIILFPNIKGLFG